MPLSLHSDGVAGAAARASRAAQSAHLYRTVEVARILGVSPARVRRLARAGGRRPQRTGTWFLFSFQDLVLLRTAYGLRAANVPARRVGRVLAQLARQLPAERPLSGVRILAGGRRVVVRQGHTAWQPEDGQVVFSFAVDELARQVRRTTASPAPVAAGADTAQGRREAGRCYDRALVLEQAGHTKAARDAYRRTIELDPTFADAHINLGRLLHESGDAAAAADHYRQALVHAPEDAVGNFNLAVALEDLGQPTAAVAHYQRAIALDAEFADAHFNLGSLFEKLNLPADATRHLGLYRRLIEGSA